MSAVTEYSTQINYSIGRFPKASSILKYIAGLLVFLFSLFSSKQLTFKWCPWDSREFQMHTHPGLWLDKQGKGSQVLQRQRRHTRLDEFLLCDWQPATPRATLIRRRGSLLPPPLPSQSSMPRRPSSKDNKSACPWTSWTECGRINRSFFIVMQAQDHNSWVTKQNFFPRIQKDTFSYILQNNELTLHHIIS